MGQASSKALISALFTEVTFWSISVVLWRLVLVRLGSFLRISSNFSQSVFLTSRICLGSVLCPVVMSNMIYLWSELE